MPSERPNQRFQDIIDNIDDALSFAEGINTPEQLASDRKTTKAIKHSLLIIGEAATKLGERAQELCPGIPWKQIRGMANKIRHEYDELDFKTILDTIHDDLPPLRAACLAALEKLGG